MTDMIPVNLSTAQLRKLRMGGAIGLKPTNFMMSEGHTPAHSLAVMPANLRKIASANRRNKGMRLMLKPGEDVVDTVTGGSILGDIRGAFKKVSSTLKSASDKAVGGAKKTVGSVVKGVRSVGRTVERGALRAANTVGRETVKFAKSKELKRVGRKIATPLIRKGIPIAASALGSALGSAAATVTGNPEFAPIAGKIGAQLGREGGVALSKYVTRKTGYGVLPSGIRVPMPKGSNRGGIRKMVGEGFLPAGDKSGSGISISAPSAPKGEYIQTGSPYAAINSASMNPFIAPSIQLAGKKHGAGFMPAGG